MALAQVLQAVRYAVATHRKPLPFLNDYRIGAGHDQ